MSEDELEFSVNKLVLGDNLEVLKTFPDELVDMIYLDPPFFSNRHYEVIWGDKGEIRSFEDRWAGGIDHYIEWLKERVVEMHRVLKSTGTLYLHCDWHADAYIRVYILDKIFGEKNYRNEIAWCYRGAGYPKNDFGKRHDTIYRYSKTNKYIFNLDEIREPYAEATQERFKHYIGNVRKGKDFGQQELNPMGRHPDDWWEIQPIAPSAKERIGYPTQKPEALLEKIVKASSNEGDIVLDPFMGGGTTIVAADKLQRQWIGIDQSPMAVKVTEFRLQNVQNDQLGFAFSPYTVQLYKYDYDTLRYKDAFQFESWIVQQFGGKSNTQQRGDFGIDGRMGDNTPIQVKRSDTIGRNVVDNFLSAVQRFDKKLFEKNKKEKKPVGYIIAFSFAKGTIGEVSRLNNEENIIIKLVRVEDIVPIAVKPNIAVHVNELSRDVEKGTREIELQAAGDSPAGIEFYSWDFNYNPEKKRFKASVLMDKIGKQTISLKAGTYTFAVKVVDNDGLENMETVKLTINGKIKRE